METKLFAVQFRNDYCDNNTLIVEAKDKASAKIIAIEHNKEYIDYTGPNRNYQVYELIKSGEEKILIT